MRIIIEEVEGSLYQDVILTNLEAGSLLQGYIVEGETLVRGKRLFTGVRVGEEWKYPSTLSAEQFINDITEQE
jgi:hypothetical protein